MVVIGDATFLDDSEIQQTGEIGQNILTSLVAWLRGKPELDEGEVKPQERRAYTLRMTSDQKTRIRWMPQLTLLLTIIVVGVGVGILRRK